MAKDLNRWTGIGRLGRDIELRYLPSGDAVANLSIACSESYKDKESGEQKERTEWVPLVLFGKSAEVAGKYLAKGSRIYAEGRFSTRKWQDKEGKDRYSTEIRVDSFQMLDGKPAGDERGQDRSGGRSQPSQAASSMDESDDIPF